jgi:hypothetical protein
MEKSDSSSAKCRTTQNTHGWIDLVEGNPTILFIARNEYFSKHCCGD